MFGKTKRQLTTNLSPKTSVYDEVLHCGMSRCIISMVRPSEVGDVCDTSIKSMQKASKQKLNKSKKSKKREPLKELQQNA